MTHPEPYTSEEIIAALRALSENGLQLWSDFPATQFAARIGEAWSPADNVRHLIKSTLPVTKALKLPGLMLRSLFGAASEPSSTYSELVARYKLLLEAGGNAGKFAPSTIDVPDDLASWQSKLIETCKDSLSDLSGAVGRWSEADLDHYRLPHPLLGKLTLREMLMFTVYHYSHHQENVVRRLRAANHAVSSAS